jgi:hypothetical protein
MNPYHFFKNFRDNSAISIKYGLKFIKGKLSPYQCLSDYEAIVILIDSIDVFGNWRPDLQLIRAIIGIINKLNLLDIISSGYCLIEKENVGYVAS